MKGLSQRKVKKIEKTLNNDRSYKRVVYNRFFVFAISVLVQIAVYVLALVLVEYGASVAVQFVFGIASVVTVIWLINRTDRPQSRIAWIILILVFPVVGISMYLSFGDGRPTRKMNKKLQAVKKERTECLKQMDQASRAIEKGGRYFSVCNYLSKVARYPSYVDGNVEYYPTGAEGFKKMMEAIESAEKFILVEYFIVSAGEVWDTLREALLKKANEGVKIRFIYDDFGSLLQLPPHYAKYFESLHENVKCLAFNPVVPIFAVRMNNRDHRKILVVDGKVAFTGGLNLADEYVGKKIRFGNWKDSVIKVTGGAVNSFTAMFFDLWNAFYTEKEELNEYLVAPNDQETGSLVTPYDDSPLDKLSTGETVYLDLINAAQKYVYIFTPYLILDDIMRLALCAAAARGVDVRIVTPGIPDKKTAYRLTRANYEMLLKSGVKIYEYTPGFIHSKSMLCDGEVAVVGTINLDYRSLYLHFENAVLFSDETAIAALKKDCEETFAISRLRTLESVKRGVFGRLFDSVLRLFETIF